MLASKRRIIKLLEDATNPGNSAEELMAVYIGREEKLIKNLKTMKSKQMAATYKRLAQMSKRRINEHPRTMVVAAVSMVEITTLARLHVRSSS